MAVTAPAVFAEQPRPCFEDIYAAHQPRVYRTCLAILRNHDDAAEATQEVFSRALPLLTELREPQVWLTTVARNYCFDQLRRQKVRGIGAVLDEDTPGSRRDDPERETMLRDALRHAFDALSGRERRALARVLLMDDSLGDIADMLGVSYGAAAQVVSRARRRAALAARAVIGASLGWLIRVAMPQQRSRVARLAAGAVENGQHLLIAAAVVLTAGGLTQVQAVAPAAVGRATVTQSVAGPARAVARTVAPAPAPVAPPLPAVHLPGSALPAGYAPGAIAPVVTGAGGHAPGSSSQNQSAPSGALTVDTPGVKGNCVVGGVGVSSGGQTVAGAPVDACAP